MPGGDHQTQPRAQIMMEVSGEEASLRVSGEITLQAGAQINRAPAQAWGWLQCTCGIAQVEISGGNLLNRYLIMYLLFAYLRVQYTVLLLECNKVRSGTSGCFTLCSMSALLSSQGQSILFCMAGAEGFFFFFPENKFVSWAIICHTLLGKRNNLVIFVSPYLHFESICSQTPPPAVYFVF